ncbi:13737_t:CDS:10 [Acaulospora colombiana]|uniref:13737_t:CDS:1 n=1 Tax=Acaulospora colombiana TaxID=27376 RepID=A0ACA9K5R4_9GLOM|nr:13737_t:CDS:10 [Acaulospora colombiana]
MLSLEQAIILGADGIESDVRITKDGHIIMMHDTSLDRTTNGTGLVEERNWKGYVEYLKSGDSEDIPEFQQVLDLLKRESVYLILDIKEDNNIYILDAISDVIRSNAPYDFSSQIYLGIWTQEFLVRARQVLPDFPISHIGSSIEIARQYFSNVESYNMEFTYVLEDVTGFAEELKLQGKKLFVWTVDEESDMRKVMLYGVDAVLSDDPVKCANVRREVYSDRIGVSLIKNVPFSTTTLRLRSEKASRSSHRRRDYPPPNPHQASPFEVAKNAKNDFLDRLKHQGDSKKVNFLEKIFNLSPSLRPWSEETLENILLEFERSREVRKQGTEMGIQIMKFRSAIRKFVEKVWHDGIERCNREALRSTYVEGGNLKSHSSLSPPHNNQKEAVEKLLKAAFMEFSQDFMSDEDKERFNSLKQLSDLSFPAEWHPVARTIQRYKIIFHINANEYTTELATYNALKCLEGAKSGLYCGPLRLLAHEVFDRFNNKGIPCNLVTGEERRELEGAYVPLTSSTIEMANLQKQIDVAVIDEIQMIGDTQRGWAWTQALLGLQAKEIHLCGEPSAVPLIRSICRSIDEDIEVREYKRLSELSISQNSLDGDLRKIQKGDCVVTFSRKSIFALKHEIEEATGLRCAVAYGSLPPETRSQQAKLFNDPGSGFDVLIASDAVGMGLNLNIKRVVFETVKKFDGTGIRYVPIPQIKQIAGRAGRFGTTNVTGEVTALEPMDLRYIHQAMASPTKNIEMAGLQPTMEMVELFAHQLPSTKEFSSLLNFFEQLDLHAQEKFEDLARVDGQYFLCNFHTQKLIANSIEHIPMTIPERFSFVTGPVNTSDVRLMKNIQKTLKIPRKRHRTTTKDIRVLGRLEQKNRVRDNKSTNRIVPIDYEKTASLSNSHANTNKATKRLDKLTI